MNNLKEEDSKTHLHFGHLGLILLCAGLLVGITFMKGGFKLSLGGEAKGAAQKYTLEQARRDVALELGEGGESLNNSNTANQLALLDLDLAQGSVLGASTEGDGVFPAAEEIFTPQVLDVIKLNIINENSKESIIKYARDSMLAESESGAFNLLASLNSTDSEVLLDTSSEAKKIVSSLAKIQVPGELEEYHKLKMIYYITLGDLGGGLGGASAGVDFDSAAVGFFSLADKLGKIETEIFNKYEVRL